MHHQSAMQHSFWLNPDGARSKSILVACICIVMTVAVSSLSKQGHHNPRMLVLSAFEGCGVVVFLISFVVAVVLCVTLTFLWFETSLSIRILNSCRDVQRSYKHNLWQFLLQFQTGQSWYNKSINSSHSQYLLNLFLLKKTFNSDMKTQVNILEKWLLLQK